MQPPPAHNGGVGGWAQRAPCIAACLQAFTFRALHEDFEDNLVVGTAREAGADFLVSSDAKLQARAPMAVLSPEAMDKLLAAEGV